LDWVRLGLLRCDWALRDQHSYPKPFIRCTRAPRARAGCAVSGSDVADNPRHTAMQNLRIALGFGHEDTKNGPWTTDKSQPFAAHVHMRVRATLLERETGGRRETASCATPPPLNP
jgi:hypothetical protein